MPRKTKKAPSVEKAARVTRAAIAMPADSAKTVAQLQADIDNSAKVPPAAERKTVARKNIYVAEDVFQWRGDRKKDRWARENHIYNLAKALQHQEQPFDPLQVLRIGERYYVMDGHHRLAAYDTAKWTKGIPVETFAGTLAEARLRALAANTKDQLPMTSGSKGEAAWRIVKERLGDLRAEDIAKLTSISRRQVFYMRKVWRELNDRTDLDTDQRADLAKLTWAQAKDMQSGMSDAEFDAAGWKERKAEELLQNIRRHNVAAGLLGDTEVSALALHMLDEKLPQALIEEWTTFYPELFLELATRIKSPPPDLEF